MLGLKHIMRAFGKRDFSFRKVYFSQYGEDVIIKGLFRLKGIRTPSYLDIGAHHPWSVSNTAIFYLAGAKGVNIEANPVLATLIAEERPRDTTLNIGIAAEGGEMLFFEFEDSSLSTFSMEEANKLIALGRALKRHYKVPVTTVQNIIDGKMGGRWPMLFCIDVEGMDEQIIESIELIHPNSPLVICAETAEYSLTGSGAKRNRYMSAIESLGYVQWADTNLNTIYISIDFWDRRV